MTTRRVEFLIRVTRTTLAGLLLFPLVAFSEIRGPILGYVFDEAEGGLRPILGVPGASRLGEVLNTGKVFTSVQVAPSQEYALGVASEDSTLMLVDLLSGTESASVRSIQGIGAGLSQMELSAQGKAAALYYSGTRTLKVLTGLPEAPILAEEIALPPGSGSLQAVCISNDGNLVLWSAAEGEASRVYLYSKQSGIRPVAVVGRVSAMRLLDNAKDVLVADSLSHEVLLLGDILGSAQRLLLANQQDGISSPTALNVSRDNRKVFVANSGSGTVTTLDLEGGASQLTSCNCNPTILQKLEGDSVFRLTDLGEKPLLILENSPTESRVLFVPHTPNQAAIREGLPQRSESRPLRVRGPRRTSDQ